MIGAMGLAFAACEPALIDGPEPYAPVESTVLADGITYTQYADKECTQPDPNGNFVKFSSAAGVVQVMVEGIEDYNPDTSGIVYVYNPPRAIENIIININRCIKDIIQNTIFYLILPF